MTAPVHYDLSKPAPLRIAALRRIAARTTEHTATPKNWREARRYKLSTWRDAHIAGIHQAPDSWYTHGGEQFRNERDAHDVLQGRRGVDHTGWFTDTYCDETAVGIVAGLPHGRFIAGYRWTSNDERVYFPEVFTCEREAARAADGHAESFAESAREDSERFDAMTLAEENAEQAAFDLANAYQARNVNAWHREHCRELIERVRQMRDEVKRATETYERG